MTTVSYDGRYLAADTLSHRCHTPSNMLTPKVDMIGGFAYAVAGEWYAMFGTMIAWHRAGANPADFPNLGNLKGAMMAIEIGTRRMWIVTSECHSLDEEAAPFTLGSGGDYALTAMDCDRNAMEGVALAARRDLHTNDVIDFIDLEWPEKGVQRWEGYPSSTSPHPVRGDVDVWGARQPQTANGAVGSSIPVDVGNVTDGFDEQDAPPYSALYLPDYEHATEEYAFDEMRVVDERTAHDASRVLSDKIAVRLADYPYKGTINWRVRPEICSYYDILTDETTWRGYARFVVLPWKRPVPRSRYESIADMMHTPLVAGMHHDVDDVRPSGKCDWAIGYPKPPCRKCSTCLYVFGDTDEQPKSSIISREEVNRLFNPGLHAILAEDTDEDGNPRLCAHELKHTVAAAAAAGVIGAVDVCEHGYVKRTCTSCNTVDMHKQHVAQFEKTAAEIMNRGFENAKKATQG